MPAVPLLQGEQPADHKGKQKQPSSPQVEPACPPMEDEITPTDLYTDIPMTADELVVQGTMFPNFNGAKFPYRVLHLGQGNDSVRSILFMRINNNLYTYGDEMIRWLVDAPPVPPAPAVEEPRPTVLLTLCIATQSPGGPPPNQYQRPPELSQPQGGAHPSGKKTRGAIPKLPHGAPPVHTPVDDWVKFIHQYQSQSDNSDKSSELSRMFPRALGFSSCPDDDKAELAPIPQRDHDQNVWLHELIHLLTVKGQYRALLEWAEVAPADGPPAPWEGGFSHVATMADVAAYLVANGVMYHDADNALKWAQRVGNEYIAQIISNGGDKDPNTKAIIDHMRATLNELLPMGEHHSLEWVDLQAHVLGVSSESIAPYEAHLIKERDLYVLREFTKSAALYALPHHASGEGNNAGGALPVPANTLEEGEMEDDLRPM
ncbi:hypothetical protein EDD17DRAFT_1753629 [Pisolithus thermaeus]|nr:hypothetical protein EDD17DRAFT_1753629 [Pisolithus thermaeus]